MVKICHKNPNTVDRDHPRGAELPSMGQRSPACHPGGSGRHGNIQQRQPIKGRVLAGRDVGHIYSLSGANNKYGVSFM